MFLAAQKAKLDQSALQNRDCVSRRDKRSPTMAVKNYQSYSSSIYTTMLNVATSLGLPKPVITNKAMAILNSFLNDAISFIESNETGDQTTLFKNVPVDHANKKRVGAVLHRYTVEIFTRAFSLKEVPVRITPKVLRPILSNESRNFAPKVWRARFGAQRVPDFQFGNRTEDVGTIDVVHHPRDSHGDGRGE